MNIKHESGMESFHVSQSQVRYRRQISSPSTASIYEQQTQCQSPLTIMLCFTPCEVLYLASKASALTLRNIFDQNRSSNEQAIL